MDIRYGMFIDGRLRYVDGEVLVEAGPKAAVSFGKSEGSHYYFPESLAGERVRITIEFLDIAPEEVCR